MTEEFNNMTIGLDNVTIDKMHLEALQSHIYYNTCCRNCNKWLTQSCIRMVVDKHGNFIWPSGISTACEAFDPNEYYQYAKEVEVMKKLESDIE